MCLFAHFLQILYYEYEVQEVKITYNNILNNRKYPSFIFRYRVRYSYIKTWLVACYTVRVHNAHET